MKTKILTTTLLIALTGPVFASGSHTGGHAVMHTDDETHASGHDHGEGHEGNMHDELAIGVPGIIENVTRTVEITMKETDDGDMIFEPSALNIQKDETIRFLIKNAGELDHEFVLDDLAAIMEHKALMDKFPEMEHDDPNSARLAAGEEGEVIWSFTNPGSFEFACLIPGHYESGMRGDVVVDAAGSADVEYTKGTVKKIDIKSGKVTIIHEELTNLGMPAMTMVFRVAEADMLKKLNAGEDIQFVADRVKGKLTVVQIR
jgi:uncharacterized cupredoxin-like copper-binding protein/Cu/Ag efflux protein CusF